MLNEKKVRLMTELAFYEQNEGKEDFKINEYYRKDYTGFHTLCSILWITVGYMCVVGLATVAGLDFLLAHLSKGMIIFLALAIIGVYLFLVITYTLVASHVFDKKHRTARQRMKKYNHNLTRLLKMYEKENR